MPSRMTGFVCLSERCHGDDGLLRGYGTHSIPSRPLNYYKQTAVLVVRINNIGQ